MRRTTGNLCAPSTMTVKKPPKKKGRERPRLDNEPPQVRFQQGDWNGMARFHAQRRVTSFFDLLREMNDHPNAKLVGKIYIEILISWNLGVLIPQGDTDIFLSLIHI